MRKLLETKIGNRNLIKGINTWDIYLVRYSGPFFVDKRITPTNESENKIPYNDA